LFALPTPRCHVDLLQEPRTIMTDLNTHLKNYIRDIPNFPIPGIMFRDITTLLADPEAFKLAIDGLLTPYRNERIDKVVVIESRGFIFGSPMAYELGAGVVPVRKPGKLPADKITEEYSLEYGTNMLQLHTDAITAGERVIIVDDLLATGGTVDASIKLVQSLGGKIVGVSFLAELRDLNGRDRISGVPMYSLVQYD
jgi:adenine phosphoribosyltransferase